MGHDRVLAERMRAWFGSDVAEKKMFGGIGFLVGGRLAAAASSKGGILLRCDPADTDELTASPGVSRFRMRGREMDGWLYVAPDAVESDEDLDHWLDRGDDYARSLPPKE